MSKYLEFDTPATRQAKDLKADFGLKHHGLVHLDRVFWNLPTAALYEEAVFRNEGHVVHGGPLAVNTGTVVLGANTLNVTGGVTVTTVNAEIDLSDPASYLNVGGALAVSAGLLDHNDGQLDAGSLTVSATGTYDGTGVGTTNNDISGLLSITGGTFTLGGKEIDCVGVSQTGGTFNGNTGRIISSGMTVTNAVKENAVQRMLLAMDALGVERALIMPDRSNLARRVLLEVEGELGQLQVQPLDMPYVLGTQDDSIRAAALMVEEGVDVLIVLGGDGTSRVVSKRCGEVPILPEGSHFRVRYNPEGPRVLEIRKSLQLASRRGYLRRSAAAVSAIQ